MPSFDFKQSPRPWVSKEPTSGTRSPHAKDSRYNSARWKRLRLAVLRNQPLCVECAKDGRTVEAKVVDHIVRVRDGGKFWDPLNLQSLCHSCHNSKSGKESHGKK